MKNFLVFIVACSLLMISTGLNAAEVPEGYRIQKLKPLEGEIIMPDSWHFKARTNPEGYVYAVSKENNEDGAYETGFTLQLYIKMQKSGTSPNKAIEAKKEMYKNAALSVIRDCDVEENDEGKKKTCIETMEMYPMSPEADYHVIYTFYWNDKRDALLTGTFKAPTNKWTEAEEVYNYLKEFKIEF